jgi:hypothetical protein
MQQQKPIGKNQDQSFFSEKIIDTSQLVTCQVYVFQFLCYAVWPQTGLVNLALFLVWTYASAFLIARCIQQPIQTSG